MGIKGKYEVRDYNIDYVTPPVTEWTDLVSLEQLNSIIEDSHTSPVIIFKHSTRCILSSNMLKNFERRYQFLNDIPKPYFLDLIAHRSISDEIALRFGIKHESPQVIFVKDGGVVKHASHGEIINVDLNNI